MAQFDIVVDTNPMARSIDSVSHEVTNTTIAVTAMETAVIAAEQQAAKHITENVDKGFFNLIQSKLSAKLAEHYTEMNAMVALMIELSKSLGGIQGRMNKDVNRLKAEYFKTFHGLDKSLENRISQLDKPAVSLAAARDKLIYHKSVTEIPSVYYSTEEIGNVRQKALTARLNSKTDRAIKSMTENVSNNMDFNQKIRSMVSPDSQNEETELCVPVIFVEEQSYVLDDSNVSMVYVPDYLSKSVREDIESCMENAMDDFDGSMDDLSRTEIRKEFDKLLSADNADQEVLRKIVELYERGGQ